MANMDKPITNVESTNDRKVEHQMLLHNHSLIMASQCTHKWKLKQQQRFRTFFWSKTRQRNLHCFHRIQNFSPDNVLHLRTVNRSLTNILHQQKLWIFGFRNLLQFSQGVIEAYGLSNTESLHVKPYQTKLCHLPFPRFKGGGAKWQSF